MTDILQFVTNSTTIKIFKSSGQLCRQV